MFDVSKSRKKKSSKPMNTGTTLGALALIISIVAMGFSVYQFITPADSGPQVYILEYDDILWIDRYSAVDTLYELNLTYSAQAGDTVVLEFSCQVYVDADSSQTSLRFNFENNWTYIPSGSIYLSSSSDLTTSGYMTHTFEASTTGEYNVQIIATCFEEVDNYVRYCLLTVTVY